METLFAKIMIKDKLIMALIDSGSSVNIIRHYLQATGGTEPDHNVQ